MENFRFKLVTSNDSELFEQRLQAFIDSLDRSAMIVDFEFTTVPLHSGGVEYSVLIHYR
ncbi:MAG: hypothetical protein WD273_08525 [Trueperaceae bacterium]